MDQSPLLDLHATANASLRADPPLVLTYGDVPGEYAAAQAGAVLFDATERGRIDVAGPEALTFLHRILANDVRGLAVGRAQRNLLLSGKGKCLFDFEITRAEDKVSISIAATRVKALRAALDMYHFSEKLTFSDATAGYAPIEVAGPNAAAILREATGLEPPRELGFVARSASTSSAYSGGAIEIVSCGVAGSPGFRVDAGATYAAALWSTLVAAGARPAGLIVRDILRVEAGAAEPGVDVDETVYPQEARLENAFSLTKGCYIGQEVVAKIDTYGGLNKRLVGLKVSHDDPLPRGTRLLKLDDGEWRDLGVVTSWAYSFVHDTGMCLAYVKRRHQAIGTQFRVGDGPATATIVPIPARANALPVTGEFE